jgi:hypothetical protein
VAIFARFVVAPVLKKIGLFVIGVRTIPGKIGLNQFMKAAAADIGKSLRKKLSEKQRVKKYK